MKNHWFQRIASGLPAAAVLLSLAACSGGSGSSSAAGQASGKTSGDGGTFVYGMQTQPDHLDPYLSTSADTRAILFNIFEGLVKPDYDFLPNLTTAIVPKGYAQQDTHPVGTGPYCFESYTPQQALSYAVDPDAIIRTVNFGKGVRCGTPVIPGLKKYSFSQVQ